MLLELSPDQLLTTTRAVRKRLDLDRPVPRAIVEECLDLALQAPNGSNQQTWRWVLVDDPEVRAAVAKIYAEAMAQHLEELQSAASAIPKIDYSGEENARLTASVNYLLENMHRVPVLVIPTFAGRPDGAHPFLQASMWGSILPAVWSFMLALRSRGLGSAWTTIHLHKEREMAELLGIPFERRTQAGLFPVAYTLGADFKPAPRRPVQEVVRWNRWSRS
ncbi:MAG TPA: nitroreductase family protein [Steroidobacter sp.]|jgi:nitroreductase|nr:nitroreductase family protein [Steroidobacteraceae bacterium]HLS80780.1 nitroreductase family protein [Steroidobacter sp.]